MKRFLIMGLSVLFVFAFLPNSAFAIESDSKELSQFLKKIDWKQQDYINYLESKDYSLDDFSEIDELGTPLSEDAILRVLAEYNLTRSDLNALLIENGEIEKGQDVLDAEWIIFEEELDFYVDFYLQEQQKTPLTDEALEKLLEDYGYDSKSQLEAFLNSYEDSIKNYTTVEDLEQAIDDYIFNTEYGFEIEGLFEELGLTEEELERLELHLNTLPIETPAFEEKAMALSDRMAMIEEFESADDLTAEEIAEVLDIFSEFLELFELEPKYFLVKDKDKKEINLNTLLMLETVNGSDLMIEIYNTKGTFLADILLTAEMFGSDIIKETGKDITKVEKPAAAPIAKVRPKDSTPVKQTIKGGKLPDTASDYAGNALAGLALVLLGAALFRRFKTQRV